MFSSDLIAAAAALVVDFSAKGLKLATAESCTGGLIAGLLTEVPGSSVVVERGFVTYSNEAKAQMLGIDPVLIKQHGAVSEAVARAMAAGALSRAPVNVAVAVTGVAGPGGGSIEKPVGLVHFAAGSRDGVMIHREIRFGDIGRSTVRLATIREALPLLRQAAKL